MNTLEHLMFVLQNAAPNLEKEELRERISELATAFVADGMFEHDTFETEALQQLNLGWSQRYMPPAEDYSYPMLSAQLEKSCKDRRDLFVVFKLNYDVGIN
jgi:hypothetical protein